MRFEFKALDLASRRFHLGGFLALASVITLILLSGRPLALTGDEPRYVMYAVSLLKNGRFTMSLPEWQSLYLSATGSVAADLPMGGNNVLLMHGVYLPALFSPIGALFGLAGLRLASMLVGLFGLYVLLRLCRRVASPVAALLATAVAGLSLPLLPYLHLFYMETFLFTLVVVAWDRLQVPGRSTWGDAVTAVLILVIPFVHMRGAVVAAALFAMLLWDVFRAGHRMRLLGLTAMAALALALLIGFNLLIYGVVTGPVNTARPPMPWEWFSVVSMQLFNVRHGLIAFGPVWLLGYAGLLAAALRGERIAGQGLLLAFIAAVTGMGINPGECWPARFWVLSVPMLAVGVCLTWRMSRSWLMQAVVVALVCFTLVNTWLFINVPNMLVENRQTTATYQRFFDKIGGVDPGLTLPVEIDDAPDIGAATAMAIGSAIFVLLVCAALRSRRSWMAAPAAVLVLAALDLTRVSVVPKSDYALVTHPGGYDVTLKTPSPAIYLQSGHYWATWYVAPDFPRFSVVTNGVSGQAMRADLAANQVISASCGSAVQSVAVTGPAGYAFEPALAQRFVVYRSRSVVRNLFAPLRGDC